MKRKSINNNFKIEVSKKECSKNTNEDKEYSYNIKISDKNAKDKFINNRCKILPSKFITDFIYDNKVISKNDNITVIMERIKFDTPFVIVNRALYKVTPYLSNTAKDIIFYICNNIEWNVNTISFDFEDFCKEYNCSKKYFYKGIEELIEHQVIERYYNRRKVYGVNIKYIMFGNITKFIEDYFNRFKDKPKIKDGLVDIPNDIYNMYLNAIKESKNNSIKTNVEYNDENNNIINITENITDEQLEEMERMIG